MATITPNSFPLSEPVNCPKCRKEIVLFDPLGSQYYVCPSCYSYIYQPDSIDAYVKDDLKKPNLTPVLPLGTVGKLKDAEFKVIAYLEKKEAGTNYRWVEYILYHPQKGYATLAEYEGHWSFIAGEDFYPDFKDVSAIGDEATYNNLQFKLYNKYKPQVTAMLGEADWDVVNEKVNAAEFINPPFMIVKEQISNLSVPDFYLGEYMEPEVIAKAFQVDPGNFPSVVGIGAIQPSKFAERWSALLYMGLLSIAIVLAIHMVVDYITPPKEVLNDNFSIAYQSDKGGDDFKPFSTGSFKLDRTTALSFELYSPVDNNWLEASIVLVNEVDNRTWEVSKSIEYYHGYEDGENWSEGSKEETVMLSSIPAGKYHLNVYPASGDKSISNLNIKALAEGSLWRNTLITILLLCLYPLYCWYRMRNVEKQRWMNSDFSPFEE